MISDELLPLKTLAQAASGYGISIHFKFLNNPFVALENSEQVLVSVSVLTFQEKTVLVQV